MDAQFSNLSSNDTNTVKLPPISFLAGGTKESSSSNQRDGSIGTSQSTFPASFSGFRSGNQLRLPSISSLASRFQQSAVDSGSTTLSIPRTGLQSAMQASKEQKQPNAQSQYPSFQYPSRQPGYFIQPNSTDVYRTNGMSTLTSQQTRPTTVDSSSLKNEQLEDHQQYHQTERQGQEVQNKQQKLGPKQKIQRAEVHDESGIADTHNTPHEESGVSSEKHEQSRPESSKHNQHQPHHHHRHKSEDLGERIKEAQSLLKDGGHIHIVHEPHGDHHHHKVYVHNPTPAGHALSPSSTQESHKSAKDNTGVHATLQKPAVGDESNTTVQNDSTIAENSTTMNQTTILDQSMLLASQPFRKRKVTVCSRDIFSVAAKYSRREIGSVVYTDYPTNPSLNRHWRNLSNQDTEKLHEDKVKYEEVGKQRKDYGILVNKRVELLPSLISNYINCTIDVYVPYHEMFDNPNVFDKRIWGTDVYTDDSDVVAILYHCGILHSQDPTRRKLRKISKRQEKEQKRDIDANASPMNYQFTSYSGPITPGNKENMHNITGNTVTEEEAADLIVTLIILPTLKEYKGCYRNNYYSRSWKDHDGCSIAVYGVRWCKLGEGINFSGVSRYGTFRKKMLNERLEIAQRVRNQKDPEPRLDGSSESYKKREKAGQWTGGRKFSQL